MLSRVQLVASASCYGIIIYYHVEQGYTCLMCCHVTFSVNFWQLPCVIIECLEQKLLIRCVTALTGLVLTNAASWMRACSVSRTRPIGSSSGRYYLRFDVPFCRPTQVKT
jgi:hypothetical protein